jgi:2'-hydroxyisoflavone reductase
MNRRYFLKTSLFVGGSAIAGVLPSKSAFAARATKNILILGGTGYLGPAVVEAALIGNHNVTLFNRGITHPELFPHLEKLRGVRAVNTQRQNLFSLEGSRHWDAVIDVWPHEPTIPSGRLPFCAPVLPAPDVAPASQERLCPPTRRA